MSGLPYFRALWLVGLALLAVAQVLTPEQRATIGEEMNSRRRGPMAK